MDIEYYEVHSKMEETRLIEALERKGGKVACPEWERRQALKLGEVWDI